jgi:uncharacterized membrane protein YvbJ
MYCKNCGAEIKNPEEQKYCEQCGSTIPSINETQESNAASVSVQTNDMGFQPYNHPGGLFDLSRNFYILKEKLRVINF